MTKITGTNISAPVVPQDTADTYPTHLAKFGKGGWRSAATLAERNAIPADRLEDGGVVYVVADETPYIWTNGRWQDFVATQAHLDEQAIQWATRFIDLQGIIASRWNDEWGKTP